MMTIPKLQNECWWLVTVLLILFSPQSASHSIVRRNAFQMCNLINLYTGSSCLKYSSYGCFCGYGQQGTQPIDEVDRCCKEHDDCYGEVHSRNHCNFWSGLFVGYNHDCEDNNCRCTDLEKCARKVCECDLKLAECFGKTTYHELHKDYDRRQCL